MNLTRLLRPLFVRRAQKCVDAAVDAEAVQRRELARLVADAGATEWGRQHGYGAVRSYSDYVQAVGVTPYDELRPYVMRMIAGERDVLWRGVTRRFAQSSGTSDGKSKYIPVTAESLKRCHYRGASDSVALYLSCYGDSRIFDGKSFILGGSYANELNLERSGARVGDLSATLIDCINPLVNLVRVPSKKVALMQDWHQKLPALVRASSEADVTNISGVPSWFLTVLREIIKAKGARNIHEVWPRLEVFFHGGIAFGPYKKEYMSVTDPAKMRYWENYNASEGFFAAQLRPDSPEMLLMMDAGVFYEFVPAGSPEAEPVPVWEVVKGEKYALVTTSCNGLWRYPIGDVVKIESVNPITITIAGRTKSFINAFGEEVMVYNTDAAIRTACDRLGCAVKDYTVAPVFSADGNKGRHEWLVEFSTAPADMIAFAKVLDDCLKAENSDYQAKRAGDIFLDNLTVVEARRGLFDAWLESTGKLGGQRKVPRLSNDRSLMEQMLSFNK